MGTFAVALLSILVAVEVIAVCVIAGVLFVVGTGTTTLVAAGMLALALVSCVGAWLFVRRGADRTA